MTSAVETNVPSAVVVLPASNTQAFFRAGVGVVLIALGIACQVAGAGFPYNAPVEMAWNFFITVSLVGAGIALIIFAILAARRTSNPTIVGRFSPLVIAAAVMIGVTLLAFLLTAGPALAADGRLRYMNLTFGLAMAGAPWGTGMVFAAVGFRAWSQPSRIVAIVLLAVSVLLAAFAIYVAAIYSAGLTD